MHCPCSSSRPRAFISLWLWVWAVSMIWVLPDALWTRPTSLVVHMQAIRYLNFECLMLCICAASWVCVIGLRKQVDIYAASVEKQEAERGATAAATAAAAAVAAATAAATVSSSSQDVQAVAPAPPAAVVSSLRVVVVPTSLTVGGSISVPAPSASSVAGPSGNGRVSGVSAVSVPPVSGAVHRLTDLRVAARKLRTLFVLIQCVVWAGVATNVGFLSNYFRGRMDPYYTDTDHDDSETYKIAIDTLPIYAAGTIVAVAVLIWYVWIDADTWKRHLRKGGVAKLAALVWLGAGAQENGHTRQSQATVAAAGAGAFDRRVHPAPVAASTLGAKCAWSVPASSPDADGPAAGPRLSGAAASRHSGKAGGAYLLTSPTRSPAHTATQGDVSSDASAALSTPVGVGVGVAAWPDLAATVTLCSGASTPVDALDGSDDADGRIQTSGATQPQRPAARDEGADDH